MDHLNAHSCIVEKLHKLDCTLLGNKDDAWVNELLFQPGFHRYHLIEWLLSKLGFDIGKVSGPQNSAEERMKNLQSVISDLGICSQNSDEIIKGTATVKKQLEFWSILVDLVWLQHEIIMPKADRELTLPLEKNKCIDEEYEHIVSMVKKICESVNINRLFESKFQLLSPDVEREVKSISPSKSAMYKCPTRQDLQGILDQLGRKSCTDIQSYKMVSHHQENLDEKENDNSELNELEKELDKVSVDLQCSIKRSFYDMCGDLRSLILDAKGDEFTDIGIYLKNLIGDGDHLECLSQIEKSIEKLQSANLTVSDIRSKLGSLLSQEILKEDLTSKILECMLKDEN